MFVYFSVVFLSCVELGALKALTVLFCLTYIYMAASTSAPELQQAVRPAQSYNYKPTGIQRPKQWSSEVEDAYRFQLAGYRDEREYAACKGPDSVERWPENGFVKKLQRKDGNFYYYNQRRECADKDVGGTKIYSYAEQEGK